jgi:septal ring factor EnvC (AmiA/AmiB activator)
VRRPFAVLALLLLAVAPAPAQEESREAELERLRGEITRLQSLLVEAQRHERSLAGDLERTGLELSLQERRLAEAETARALTAARIDTGVAEVARLQGRLVSVRADLRGRLTGLYRLGRAGYLRVLLALAPGQQVLPAIRQLRYLARRDGELLAAVMETQERLTGEQRELEAERQRLEGWVRQERERRRSLATLRQRQAALLARAEKERRSLESESGALEEQAERLTNLLAFLSGRRTAPQGTPIQGFRGALEWPADGAVAIPFGPRLDPRYRTKVPHPGVTLATIPGGEARAVFAGTVAFAAPFQGYGPTVIVQHPGRAFTLYAGLAELRAAARDVLTLGQTVGLTGDQLYFEIRIDNRPENPVLWLRGSR